jgi:hypothetical protein
MGVLQDFERRLEGAVEGFFARAFRSGLQPVELAKALQRYAEDNRHVAEDGAVVPNGYRLQLSPKDTERLSTYGDQLRLELIEVLERTAVERDWRLRGPVEVLIEADDAIAYGRYELSGRVVPGPRPAARPAPPAPPRPTVGTATASAPPAADTAIAAPVGTRSRPMLEGPDGARLTLERSRHTLGRLPDCDLVLDDHTVSREHAAVVRRGDRWWVLDLGSTNGTRVNGVQAAEQPLRDGDEIELGDAVVVFREVS